ncbi:hypothetical protein ACFQRK_19780 [Parapedobacter sp. GCM10030251]|uniref:hypothetical protein n=1 Tax=Parapedobacter sp. GCM10030251 TaxID=3273419 RepID=UPI003621A299
MLLWLVIIGLLVRVAWEDFKYRAVLVLLFPILGSVAISHAILLGVFSIKDVAVNLIIVTVQSGILAVVLFRRKGSWKLTGSSWIGWGDIAFLVVMACCFSTANFVLFYSVGVVLVLFESLLAKMIGFQVKHILLAGGQALILAIVYLCDHMQLGASLFMDVSIFRILLDGITAL